MFAVGRVAAESATLALARPRETAQGDLIVHSDPRDVLLKTPMTFMHKGKQYIVFATGAGSSTSLVALALP